MQIETWPIDKLVFYARNPRKNDSAVDRMCGSIREFGFKIPVLARSDGTVVDGHLRIKAARKLGSWSGGDTTAIPVIFCDDWTDAQVKAFRLLVRVAMEMPPHEEPAPEAGETRRRGTLEGDSMNLALPPGDRGYRGGDPRRESGPRWVMSGTGRLVLGATAAARKLTIGHRCATVGSRSLGWRSVAVWANAPVFLHGTETIAVRRRKPAAAVPGGPMKR